MSKLGTGRGSVTEGFWPYEGEAMGEYTDPPSLPTGISSQSGFAASAGAVSALSLSPDRVRSHQTCFGNLGQEGGWLGSAYWGCRIPGSSILASGDLGECPRAS